MKKGDNDILYKYSLLSQLGFVISAKEKLREGGSLVTLIGGRIPTEAIEEFETRECMPMSHAIFVLDVMVLIPEK